MAVVFAATVAAQTDPGSDSPRDVDPLWEVPADDEIVYGWAGLFPEDVTCFQATSLSQQFIPYYMVSDEPDSVLMMIDFWEVNCGSAEPLRRIRILASIWDDAFTEDLYDSRLIEDLAWRFDPARSAAQGAGDYGDLGRGNVASVVDFYADAEEFDEFTVDLADQLLPHAESGTEEQFFCLFYSGRTTEAFALLAGPELEGTELHRRYHRALSGLKPSVWKDFWGVSGGFRRSMAGLGRVGNHATVGLFVGRQWPRWSVQTGLSLRLGRADEPYWVSSEDFDGLSDRYGGMGLFVEVGLRLLDTGPIRHELLLGGAAEALSPFKNEKDLVLTTFHGYAGWSARYAPGPDAAWFADLDLYREWISDPAEEGTDLGGDAWNVRLSLGFNLVSDADRRLTALGR